MLWISSFSFRWDLVDIRGNHMWQMQPQRSHDKMRVEEGFRTHWFQLLFFSWLKLKITGFGLDPPSFRNEGITAVYISCMCSHSQSPKAACSRRAAELGEPGWPLSSPNKVEVLRWVWPLMIYRAGGFINRYGRFLLLLVSRTEICYLHEDLLPWALVIH